MSGAAVSGGGILHQFFSFSLVSNAPRQPDASLTPVPQGGPACWLLVMEFDDQGLCYARASMAELERALYGLRGKNPIIVVFAHGWKHNAAPDDTNLADFQELLAATATLDGALAGGARPILGVFMSWRGLSRNGNWFWKNSSFWDRQQAGHRVALGSPREALGRCKNFRNGDDGKALTPQATLIIIGHSFGAMVVYSAAEQSLIEAASTSAKNIPSFGDLVLLVNPAFSAVSYLPVYEIVQEREFDPEQLPIFVSVTALNDLATKIAYPLGNALLLVEEAVIGRKEREALIRTMGHLEWMRTHALSGLSGAADGRAMGEAHAQMRAATTPGSQQTFGTVVVKSRPDRKASPFWVASATPDVINGHTGIFTDKMRYFVYALVEAHLQQSAQMLS